MGDAIRRGATPMDGDVVVVRAIPYMIVSNRYFILYSSDF